MNKLVTSLMNDNLIPLKPYESARRLFSGGQDWLNANESPYASDYQIDSENFNRYPSCQPTAVVESYARYADVHTDQVLVTRGADEGIELLIRTFCTPGKSNVLICPPTYGMYAISAETCDVGVRQVPLNDDFSLDVDGICAQQDVNLVFICSPNNPTGTRVATADIERVLSHFADSALVVVDEAYIEFDDGDSWAARLDEFNNLVILRTLSKAFGLAGLRCGFTLASGDIIRSLMKVIAPYPIPEPVAQIAAQALSDEGVTRINVQVQKLNLLRNTLQEELAQRAGITLVGDITANFVLFHFTDCEALMAFLVENGMLIRNQSKQHSLQNCLRATVGNEDQNARLLSLIDQFIEQKGVSA